MTELKPCPFCGGEAKINRRYFCLLPLWFAVCGECLASTVGAESEESAVATWNTRAEKPVEKTVKNEDVTIGWPGEKTTRQACDYLLTNGLVPVELYRAAIIQADKLEGK